MTTRGRPAPSEAPVGRGAPRAPGPAEAPFRAAPTRRRAGEGGERAQPAHPPVGEDAERPCQAPAAQPDRDPAVQALSASAGPHPAGTRAERPRPVAYEWWRKACPPAHSPSTAAEGEGRVNGGPERRVARASSMTVRRRASPTGAGVGSGRRARRGPGARGRAARPAPDQGPRRGAPPRPLLEGRWPTGPRKLTARRSPACARTGRVHPGRARRPGAGPLGHDAKA